MTVFNFTIKRKWFDLICSGEKKEEYRTMKQLRRLLEAQKHEVGDEEKIVLILRNGYSLKSMAVAVDVTLVQLRSPKNAIHPEWGEPTTGKQLHFVMRLGKLHKVAQYGEIRKDVYAMGGAK